MARIAAQTLRTARFSGLHGLRGFIWSFAKNLRGFSRSPGLRFLEPTIEFLDSKILAVFQTLQPKDQVT